MNRVVLVATGLAPFRGLTRAHAVSSETVEVIGRPPLVSELPVSEP